MIWVAYSTIKISSLIADHILEISLVEIAGQSLLEVDCKPLIQEIQERVDKGSRDSDKSKIKHSLNEDGFAFLDDGFDDFTIQVSDVDTEEGSQDQEDCKKAEIEDLLAFPCWYDDFDKLFDPLEKNGVDIAFSSFLNEIKITFYLSGMLTLMLSLAVFLFLM